MIRIPYPSEGLINNCIPMCKNNFLSNETLNLTSLILEEGIQPELRFKSTFWSDYVGTEDCEYPYILDDQDEYFILPSGLLHHVNHVRTPFYCVETFQVNLLQPSLSNYISLF